MSGITWMKKNIPMRNKITIRNVYFLSRYLGNFFPVISQTRFQLPALNETSGLNGLIRRRGDIRQRYNAISCISYFTINGSNRSLDLASKKPLLDITGSSNNGDKVLDTIVDREINVAGIVILTKLKLKFISRINSESQFL